jgi:NAD-dependent DNA ligase
MLRSNAGKARISIAWMITVGVLFLVALVFAFISQDDLSTERENVAAAKAETAAMTTQVEALLAERRNLSTVLGWYDRQSADQQSSPEAAKKALEELKGTFPDLGAAEKDFESSIPKILAAFNERARKIGELETRVKGLESELSAAQTATTQVSSEKDATIAGLRQQMADEQRNAGERVTELESRIEQARTQLAELDGEVRKAREAAGQDKRRFEAQKAIDDARISQLSSVTAFARDPFWRQPDGRVLEVSDRLGSGWIDIGANQRVVRGIVFEVRSPGDDSVKAYAEVTAVKANSAEVKFTGVVDRFSPPVAGDVVANRLYDPVGGRNAVLVGRFSGTFNDTDLKTLLQKMGIQVQPRVDKTTHFLIVGSEIWSDPDTGEPLAESRQPSDLPEYKQAEALGVQIVPIQDIREHFRLGAGQ